ncbi:TRAP-type C4-dicarboxylate transport system permease small subunit [Nocardia transvalensis]|uniref:TRAP-type C4-dicarboxylate transport system permease small subunit n=1 Tax=Nocardia transvalensis TaxID=37333 RepID=A0A7W9PJI5_9NOCA|nr:hypothetical protein [Nocardia transvalensis]MBB5916873.1 TRAP-type C4-dicarboxylate transport system permease small subunit [Nocardia transvalensis]
MIAKPLPATVLEPLTQLLSWLAWTVLLVCIARVIVVGGQLATRLYREEAIEGLGASLFAAVLVGAASGLAAALLPNH